MPIKKATAFTASDGSLCATLEEAQRVELEIAIFGKERSALPMHTACCSGEFSQDELRDAIVNTILGASDEIVDVLTTGPRSRPSTRKVKGARKNGVAEKARILGKGEARAA